MKKKQKKYPVSESLPEQFLERLKTLVGAAAFFDIEKTFIERPTTFRVNTLKAAKEQVSDIMQQRGFKVRQVPWYADAFILLNRSKRELMDLPLYTQGQIYIQSLASMVPPLVLDPKPGEKVLDLTAAPGSKTSQIAAFMGRQGELVANDISKIRFFKLKHNMELLGVSENASSLEGVGNSPFQKSLAGKKVYARRKNDETEERGADDHWTFVLRMEHGSKLAGDHPEYFDKILLDAPCSAEARFVKGDVKTYGYWNEKKIKEMAYKQRQLLFSAWHALRPGGTLVYSTCTFAPEENELQVTRLLERYQDAEVLDIGLPALKTIRPVREWKEKMFHSDTQKAIRIVPTDTIEGFFVAKLRKKE